MADIFPFRGVTFDPGQAGPYDKLVTQPYDKISDTLREEYLQRNPYNIARLICSAPPGADLAEYFRHVAETYHGWLERGVLERSERPCIYPYHQSYQVPGTGERRVRKGCVALGRLHDYSDGVVRPHEQTHSGPKLDRLELTRATGSQFGQLFMLYPDSQGAVNNVLEAACTQQQPMIEVTDEGEDVLHRMWRVDAPDVIEEVQRLMSERSLYIADGHHRYETALAYYREQAEAGVPVIGPEAIDRAMMCFVSAHDPGLSVLPTHRVVFGLEDFSPADLLGSLGEVFDVADAGRPDEKNLLAALEDIGSRRHAFVMAAVGHPNLVVLTLKPDADPDRLIPGEGSREWKELDVNMLHHAILQQRLKISPEDLEHQTKVSYYRDPLQALNDTLDEQSKYQAAFFLNPTAVEQVVAVADNGEFMPQKSTDFYPKMLTGMVINKLNLK